MSLQSILLEVIIEDERILQQILQQTGNQLGDIIYKDSGSFGDVFEVIGKNKAVKITTSWREGRLLSELTKKNFDNVVDIKFSKKLSPSLVKSLDIKYKEDYADQMYLIIMEKLETIKIPYLKTVSLVLSKLPQVYSGDAQQKSTSNKSLELALEKYLEKMVGAEDAKDLIKIFDRFGEPMNSRNYNIFLNTIYITLDMYGDQFTHSMYGDFSTLRDSVDRTFFKDLINGVKELDDIGIVHNDLHIGNIMKDPRRNTYKIIDIQ